MSTNFQYRLQQYETNPPIESWNRIAERLNDEFDQVDIQLSQKIAYLEHPVPEGAWSGIAAVLDQSDSAETAPVQKTTAKIISFPLRRIAAAVVICIGISLLYYFLSPGKNDAPVVSKSTPVTRETESKVPSIAGNGGESLVKNDNVRSSGKDKLQGRRSIQSRRLPLTQASYQADSYRVDNADQSDIKYATIDAPNDPARDRNIVVSGEPIRDDKGNIIMDEKLVSARDGKYITVTGPNGAQTKISKKFMHALSYMNAGPSKDDYFGIMMKEGSLWKWLFDEWRKKLLYQDSFIPTATNFLDIMEMKEILHENF